MASDQATIAYDSTTKGMRIGYTAEAFKDLGSECWVTFNLYDMEGDIIPWPIYYAGPTSPDVIDLPILKWNSRIQALRSTPLYKIGLHAYDLWEAHFGPPEPRRAASVQSATHSRTEQASPKMTRSHQPAKDVGRPDNSANKRKAVGHSPTIDNDRNKKLKQAEVMGPPSKLQALCAERRRQKLQAKHSKPIGPPKDTVGDGVSKINKSFQVAIGRQTSLPMYTAQERSKPINPVVTKPSPDNSGRTIENRPSGTPPNCWLGSCTHSRYCRFADDSMEHRRCE
ncbi:hypothetical protein FB567DRAFT_515189 [Paraphoma chrysanthemicola]|uniref:Uncharacterized protein n=1 Tax=Paraphoma chrysanthemicola TaxID=798071 RepID=A0A8K0RD44_9PLEO|nr:hypothetical protein FB567DRAFT_515189 [Paraphoma chrysanthemicola]